MHQGELCCSKAGNTVTDSNFLITYEITYPHNVLKLKSIKTVCSHISDRVNIYTITSMAEKLSTIYMLPFEFMLI